MELLSQQIDYAVVSSRLIRLISCLSGVVEKIGPRYLARGVVRRGSRKGSSEDTSQHISPDTVFSRFEAVWSTMESWFQLFQEEISSFRFLREREQLVSPDPPVQPETESSKTVSPNHLPLTPNLGEIADKRHLLRVINSIIFHSTRLNVIPCTLRLYDRPARIQTVPTPPVWIWL